MEQSLFVDASIFLPKNAIKEKSGFFGNIESLISNEILSQLKSSRIFMIGAGALGCEHAKNLIMMNSAITKQGLLSITDPDTISLSNLSRQFLFQNDNIGDLKSKVIETKLTSYFPKTKIKSYKDAVGKETYKTSFKYDFWRTQDILLGALDNHEARLYIDKQAVKFEKPLFESGTQGTKCHTQTIIPKKTITYGEIEDPPQESIPMCTIKNFPNNFTHCIEWALEVFHGIFSQTMIDIIEIKKNKEQWLDSIRTQNNNNIFERISKVNLFLNHINKSEISNIIEEIYQEYFINPISILLNSFPEDLEENGERFWGGKRKKPQIINLSSSKEFIEGIYNGLTKVLNIYSEIDHIKLNNKKSIKTEIKFSLEELEKNKTKDINEETVGLLIENLRNFDDSKLKTMEIKTLEFDKDCDLTLEILNLLAIQRAKCYGIKIENINETRRIAGKIIPAISTTTTIVSGFVMLEILKYFNEEIPYDFNINIGINQYIGFETGETPLRYSGMFDKAYNSKVIVIPENINIWSKKHISIVDDGIITIGDLVDLLKSEFEIETIDNIFCEQEIIYPNYQNNYQLSQLWKDFEKEYNDVIILNIFIIKELPIIVPPIYLHH